MIEVTQSLLTMLREVATEVLETMFFTTAAAVPCRHDAAARVSAKVCFEGTPAGELQVTLERRLAESLSAGFLAEDESEVTQDAENQVACELANILCGAILSRQHPDSRVALGAPEVTNSESSMDDPCTHQCFETPEGMLAVTMRIY